MPFWMNQNMNVAEDVEFTKSWWQFMLNNDVEEVEQLMLI